MRAAATRLWSRLGLPGVLLLAVLALALVLRLDGIAWGLQFFYYPSLYFYLLGGLYVVATPLMWLLRHGNPLAMGAYVVDPGPYFLLGRLLSAAFGTISVYLVFRLGRVAYGRPAGLLAALFLAVTPLHVAYSHMAVTDVTATALSLLALLLLLKATQGRGRRWLVAGAVAAGLATSTKYNLGLLVLPASVAAVYACRGEVARRAAAGARAALLWPRLLATRVYAPMLAAFVLASPFVVLDARQFAHDFLRQNRIMHRGWLGFENTGNGFWYNLHVNLGGTLGVVLLILVVLGVAWALWRHTPLDLLLAPYVLVYFAYVSTWTELADRYLLPVVLVTALDCSLEVAVLRPSAKRVVVPMVGVLLAVAVVAPLTDSLRFDRGLSGVDVRERAKQWVEQNLPAGSTIAAENYGPPLVRTADEKYYLAAGHATPAYHLVRLKLPQPGVPDERRDIGWLRARHVGYVIVSSRVYGRVFAAARSYPESVAFYRRLAREGVLLTTLSPRSGERGPVLKVYRLVPRSRAPQG